MSPILSLHNIEKTYRRGPSALPVLRGITIDVPVGGSLSIAGHSGSGKSTLLHIMGALDTPTDGRVTIDGEDASALPEKQLAMLRNRLLGFVFQDHYLLPQLTALENVLVPCLASGTPSSNDRQHALALLDRVGLADRVDHRPAQLSGGECQRIAVVRALINRPRLLLADEPTGALDGDHARALADLLFELQAEQALALVMVTHAEDLAARAAHQYRMQDGQLTAITAKAH